MQDKSALINLLLTYIQDQKFQKGPQNLYEPVRYILDIGGKRIRPLLTLMAAEAFSGQPKDVLPAAFAIELFHNFSLLHDDIMDEAPLRRGRQSVHIKYGINSGILSGDVMLVLVYEYLMVVPDVDIKEILKLFNQAAIEVCEGQQLDVDFETMEEVSEELYLEMIEKKTAALLGAALGLGALPYADKDQMSHIVSFGRLLGVAFQLQDDLLDTFGDTHKVGKQKGGDIIQNKKTILTIQAAKAANQQDKDRLKYWMGQGGEDVGEKVHEVTNIYIRSGAQEYTKQKIDFYHSKAIEHLDAINLPQEDKAMLYDLAEQLMHRES